MAGTSMAGTRNLGFKLLGVWLILSGFVQFAGAFYGVGLLLGLLAFAAGLLILIGR
jgi:hypothetical protein